MEMNHAVIHFQEIPVRRRIVTNTVMKFVERREHELIELAKSRDFQKQAKSFSRKTFQYPVDLIDELFRFLDITMTTCQISYQISLRNTARQKWGIW